MYKNFLNFIWCPSCKKDLKLHIFEENEKHIESGLFECLCGSIFPIVDCIPRVYAASVLDFADFMNKYESEINGKTNTDCESAKKRALRFSPGFKQVQNQFNIQWDSFGGNEKFFGKNKKDVYDYIEKNMSYPDKGIPDLKGKTVLDAGCGHGLYSLNFAENVGTIVGFDITKAGVARTFGLLKNFPNAHVMQADAMNCPLRYGMFDFVLSEGMIHHTPNTRLTFQKLANLVKPGGEYTIWVYPHRAWWWDRLQLIIRYFTTRMSPKLLYYLCHIPVALLGLPGFKAYSGTNLKNSSYKECVQVVWDFYSPQYQTHHGEEEVSQWYLEEGFENIVFLDDPTVSIGTKSL